MLDLKYVIENLDEVKRRTALRKTEFDFAEIEALAGRRKQAIYSFETLRAEQKRASDGMKTLRPGTEEFLALRASLRDMSERAKALEDEKKKVEETLEGLLLFVPNLIRDNAPVGETAEDNPIVRTWGTPRPFDFTVRDHVDIGESLRILNFEAAVRVTGARFVFLRGQGARLERALIQFMLDLHTREHGYEEIQPPLLVNEQSMIGTGQFPKFREEAFRTDDWYLIPTAEVPVTNFLRETLIDELDEARRFVAYTPCFRREAGSHGRDTRGMIRQHQFDKVELVIACRPEQSDAWHERLTRHAETVLERLELPYRRVELCSADIGFSAARCFDIEVWLPSQDRYREISSCSHFDAFQARRAQIRYREGAGRNAFVHTINGSGLAIGRTLVAILENFQNADGSVTIPEALRPYTGFDRITL